MSSIDPRDFGLLEGQFKALHEEFKAHKRETAEGMAAVNAKMDELLSMANRSKGALWMGLTLASTFSAIVTYITTHFWPR